MIIYIPWEPEKGPSDDPYNLGLKADIGDDGRRMHRECLSRWVVFRAEYISTTQISIKAKDSQTRFADGSHRLLSWVVVDNREPFDAVVERVIREAYGKVMR